MSIFVGTLTILGMDRRYEDILCVAASIALIAFLIATELLTASRSHRALALGRFVNVAIIPLLIVFAVTVAMKVMAVL